MPAELKKQGVGQYGWNGAQVREEIGLKGIRSEGPHGA
jgi:hypothetical protein